MCKPTVRISNQVLSLLYLLWVRARPATRRLVGLVFLLTCLRQPTASPAETVTVRFPEGVSHGFLVLRTQEGKRIADGDSTQVTRGDSVTSRMRFRFKDGSIYEETTKFSQRGAFRLVSEHVIQRGSSFKQPMEVMIDATSGQVTVRYTDDGKDKVISEKLELPPDVANGILFTLLKNLPRNAPTMTLSYVATTPKPRLVKLEIGSQGQEVFWIGGYKHKAIHYVVKVKIGGVAGLAAPLVESNRQTRRRGWRATMPRLSSEQMVPCSARNLSGEWNSQVLPFGRTRLHNQVRDIVNDGTVFSNENSQAP